MLGRQFLEVARVSVEDPSEEWIRTSAGRAYYALFLEARDALLRWNIRGLSNFQAHSFVRTRFEFAKHVDAKRIGDALRDLIEIRTRADYEIGVPFLSAFLVEQGIDQADDAIQLLDAVAADPARLAAVVAAVRAVP